MRRRHDALMMLRRKGSSLQQRWANKWFKLQLSEWDLIGILCLCLTDDEVVVIRNVVMKVQLSCCAQSLRWNEIKNDFSPTVN